MPRFTPLGSGGTGCAAFGNRMSARAVDTLERSEKVRPPRTPTPPAPSATTLAVRKLRRPGCHGARGGSPDGGPLRARETGRGWPVLPGESVPPAGSVPSGAGAWPAGPSSEGRGSARAGSAGTVKSGC